MPDNNRKNFNPVSACLESKFAAALTWIEMMIAADASGADEKPAARSQLAALGVTPKIEHMNLVPAMDFQKDAFHNAAFCSCCEQQGS